MKVLAFIILSIWTGGKTGSDASVDEINQLKREAEAAFAQSSYDTAIARYHILLDTLALSEEPLQLNLAHAYLKADKLDEAMGQYQDLTSYSKDKKLLSTAYQQMGVIAHQKDDNLDQALLYLKQALRNDPGNEEARYNYELLKKLKEEKEDEQEDEEEDEQEEEEEEQQEEEEQEEEQQEEQQQEEEDKEQEGEEEQEEPQEGEEESEEQEGEQEQEQEGEGEEQEQEGEQQEQEGEQGEEDGEKKEGQQQDGDEKEETELGKEEGEEQEGKEGETGEEEGEEGQAEGEQKEGKEGQEGEDGERGEGQPTAEERLMQMNISPEKAKMILEAMRNSEVQYLQQMRRAPQKKQDRTKPDW